MNEKLDQLELEFKKKREKRLRLTLIFILFYVTSRTFVINKKKATSRCFL